MKQNTTLLVVAVFLIASIFVADLSIPIGFIVGILYLVPIGLVFFSQSLTSFVATTLVCISLIWLDVPLSDPVPDMNRIFINKGLITVVTLLVGGLLMRYRMIQEELKFTMQSQLDTITKITEAVPAAFFILDRGCHILYANQNAESILGKKSSEFIGEKIQKQFQAEDITEYLDFQKGFIDIQGQIFHRDEEKSFQASCSLFETPDPEKRVFAIRNLSEKNSFEEHIRYAQRMEIISTMIAGIAHDMNNQIMAAQLFFESAKSGFAQIQSLKYFESGLQILKKMTLGLRQILDVNWKAEQKEEMIDVKKQMEDMRIILEHIAGKEVQLKMEICENPHTIFADQGKLEQVILNIVKNAKDAIGAKGEIRIQVFNTSLEKNIFSPNISEQLAIEISDTGGGIPENLREKIFHPLFTTKKKGVGTGMGLALSLKTVRSSGGDIRLESEMGVGSKFTILFPKYILVANSPEALPETRHRPKICIVEETGLMQAFVSKHLIRAGFDVYHYEDLLHFCEKICQSNFDCMIIDLNLSNLTNTWIDFHLMNCEKKIPTIFLTEVPMDNLPIGYNYSQLITPVQIESLISEINRKLNLEKQSA